MPVQIELTKEFIQTFSDAVDRADLRWIRQTVDNLFSEDVSAVLDELDSNRCKFILDNIDAEKAADIITDIDPDMRSNFLQLFTAEKLAVFLNLTDSDDAADVLNELPLRLSEEIIAKMNARSTARVIDLMRYDENCAGGLMAKELIKVNINADVVSCIEAIRRQAEDVEKIYSVYVVDNEEVLLGRISLKRLLLAADSRPISEIFADEILSVQTFTEGEDVAGLMQKYDLEVIPVVNMSGKLMGRITVDDILDFVTEQAEADLQAVSGISENIDSDDSILRLSWARLPWLLVGMMGGLLGAQLMEFFAENLALIPAMAFFIPLITATGGNVGIQSSTIVVQALANNSVNLESRFTRVVKVLSVAVLNGTVIAVVVFTFNLFFVSSTVLALIVSTALFSVVILASFTGTITPLILDRLGINPALASGPFITTANDLMGLAVYFSVAGFLHKMM